MHFCSRAPKAGFFPGNASRSRVQNMERREKTKADWAHFFWHKRFVAERKKSIRSSYLHHWPCGGGGVDPSHLRGVCVCLQDLDLHGPQKGDDHNRDHAQHSQEQGATHRPTREGLLRRFSLKNEKNNKSYPPLLLWKRKVLLRSRCCLVFSRSRGVSSSIEQQERLIAS